MKSTINVEYAFPELTLTVSKIFMVLRVEVVTPTEFWGLYAMILLRPEKEKLFEYIKKIKEYDSKQQKEMKQFLLDFFVNDYLNCHAFESSAKPKG